MEHSVWTTKGIHRWSVKEPLFYIFLIFNKLHEKTKTYRLFYTLDTVFFTLSLAFSPKTIFSNTYTLLYS